MLNPILDLFGTAFRAKSSAPFYERTEDFVALLEIAWRKQDVGEMGWLLWQIRQEGNHPRLEPFRVYIVIWIRTYCRGRRRDAYRHILASDWCTPRMDSPTYILETGTKVITHDRLNDTQGLMINPIHLGARRPGAKGVIRGVVGGHGGDVYWVGHEVGGTLAAYSYAEFELDGPQAPKTEKARPDAYSAILGDE